ncbi:CHAT domain-containing protein, partial [Myxococcota bacterium]|nr:CHAT domain-containing protein [Myxococcota bacterium]
MVVHLEPPGVIAALWSEDEAIKSSAARLDVTLDEIGALVEEGTFTDLLPRLGGALEGVSPADLHARHLVIVPSMAAHRIPWAAAPVSGGRRLVEVTRSIAIAPCLALYATARAPARPRQGALLVTPGEERRVYNARLAFEGREGARLEGRDARLASVLDAARDVDVLVFFTHGERGRGSASLILADTPFTLTHMGDRARLAGMERVEIWACSSGLNHPNRLFLPPAHDAYGIDVEFLRAGVRTSIGTLWNVLDATTGLIAGRYAEALGRGASAVEALAEAQRWYLREFLPEAKAQSDEVSLVRLLESHNLKLGHTLGEEALEGFVTMLEEPKAWAGFRFIGVPEDRPHGEWAPTPPLTDADRAWLEAAFAEPEAELLCWDGEAWLSEARRAALEASTVERAVEVADAYRLRLEGRRVDNLALALGWSALARARASTPAQLHRVDHLEAWILFELLVGGRPIYDLVLWPPVLGWRDAAREAAARLGGAEGACLLALIDAHVARPWRRGDPTPFVQRALSAASALDDPRRRAEALVAIADVAWLCEEIPEDLIERLTAVSLPKGEAFWAARLQSRVNLRARLLTQRAGRDVGLVWWARLLPNADLAASVAWARRLGSEHDEAADTAHDSLSEDLQVLQERAWGPVMGDELGAACRRDAAPDEAWRSGVGQLHYGHIEETGGAYARRLLVDLCLGCDPGLARAARLKWLGALGTRGGYADVSDHLALPALRRTASRLFTEATIALYTTSGPLGATPVETLPDVEGWALRTLIERHPECDPRTPTILAFERAVGGMDAIIEGVLGAGPLVETLQESPELRGYAEALLPTPHLEDIERWIGELGADTLILGVGLGVGGQIVLVLHGEIRGARVSRATRSGLAVAPALMLHLTELLRLPELGGGVEEAHRGAWRGVEAALAPALEELLRDLEIPRGARLLLCAPGPFRRSPLAALEIQGVALLESFDEVIDLPSHTLSMTPSGGPPSVAQLGGEAHPVWRELAELDRAERLSDINAAPHDLPEIRALLSSPRRSTLRIFGEAWEGATGETAGVILAPERVALPSNLDELTLLGNEVVELWFPTVGVLDSLAPLHGGADQAPAWVEHAFTSGAEQVIDLAWRVPEPVLWTVIAHYSHARRRGEPPARALNIGLRACREVTRAAERGAVEAA